MNVAAQSLNDPGLTEARAICSIIGRGFDRYSLCWTDTSPDVIPSISDFVSLYGPEPRSMPSVSLSYKKEVIAELTERHIVATVRHRRHRSHGTSSCTPDLELHWDVGGG